MINNSWQSQSIMISNGTETTNRINRKDLKKIAFFTLIFLYFYLGKWKIFTIFRVSTDYLFWVFIGILLTCFLVFERKVRVNKEIIPIIIYIAYQFFEYNRSAYPSVALPLFLFNILTLWVFLFVKEKAGYEVGLTNCLYFGGIYYSIMVLLQSALPEFINHLRELLLVSVDVAFGLRGYENTTRYLSGLASNSAVAAFFIAMMVGICISKALVNNKRFQNIIIAILGFTALFLTQKRSLALGTILAVLIVVLLFRKDIVRKIRFVMLLLVLGSIAIYVMYRTMPAMTIFLNRLFQNQDLFSGRSSMYDTMMTWYQSSPIFGVGIGTANYTFGYGGHNCYRQLLGEEGIVGCIIYAILIGPYMYKLFNGLTIAWNSTERRVETEPLLSAAICLTIILIYALVGNPFYDFTFCLTLFMILAIPTQIIGGKENG